MTAALLNIVKEAMRRCMNGANGIICLSPVAVSAPYPCLLILGY